MNRVKPFEVSCVIPAYNEEKTIGKIVKDCRNYCKDIIVIVGKNSNDRTEEIAKKSGVKVYKDNGKGKGAAIRLGIEKATKNVTLIIDADGSHSPKDIPKIIMPVLKEEYDLVIGSRALGGSEELHSTFTEFFRNVGGSIIMLYINYVYNVRYTDCENGFRAIRTSVARDLGLNANDFDIEQEMVIKALKKGLRIKEVPAHEYKREYGSSKLNLFFSGWKFLSRLVREIL